MSCSVVSRPLDCLQLDTDPPAPLKSHAHTHTHTCTHTHTHTHAHTHTHHHHRTGFEEGYGHHNEIAKFLEHATLLRGLEHPNIATVLRVSAEDNLIPLVLYPIVEYGNMHNFLTFCRMSPEESPLNVSQSTMPCVLECYTVHMQSIIVGSYNFSLLCKLMR